MSHLLTQNSDGSRHCRKCGRSWDTDDRADGECVPDPIIGTTEGAGKTALEQQIGGNHYQGFAIQPIEFGHRNRLDPCAYSVLKYLTRWREKNGVEDLKKARHFVELRDQLIQDYGKIAVPRHFDIAMRTYCEQNRLAPDTSAALLELEFVYRNAVWPTNRLLYEIDRLIHYSSKSS